MIYICYGDEPYKIDQMKESVRSKVVNKAFNVSTYTGSFTPEIMSQCMQFPMMDKCRCVILDTDSLKGLDNEVFKAYLEKPSASCELLIIVRNMDKRLKLYSTLCKKGIVHECSRYKDMGDIVTVLGSELKAMGASMNKDALSEFIKRQDYLNIESLSILDLIGYLKSMAAVNSVIDIGMVERFVPKVEEPNCFLLASLISDKNVTALKRQLDLIDDSESQKILGLILKEIRVCYKSKLFAESKVGAKPRTSFSSLTIDKLKKCMDIVVDAMQAIKEGRFDASFALESACIRLCSII